MLHMFGISLALGVSLQEYSSDLRHHLRLCDRQTGCVQSREPRGDSVYRLAKLALDLVFFFVP